MVQKFPDYMKLFFVHFQPEPLLLQLQPHYCLLFGYPEYADRSAPLPQQLLKTVTSHKTHRQKYSSPCFESFHTFVDFRVGNTGIAPVSNIGITPVGNTGITPVGNTGFAPVGNKDIAPVGNTGIAPVGNIGITPLGNTGITPVGNTVIAPVGNTGITPVGNTGIAILNSHCSVNFTPCDDRNRITDHRFSVVL
jgi:hypothetical protein